MILLFLTDHIIGHKPKHRKRNTSGLEQSDGVAP